MSSVVCLSESCRVCFCIHKLLLSTFAVRSISCVIQCSAWRWVAAAWGRNDSLPPRVRRALAAWDGNACETEGWKLARYAEMSAMDTHVEWWAFCRVWPRHPAARAFRLPAAARTRALEAACAACMTAEQRAMLGCANRLLQLEGLPSR